jgi:hypothetical protein
MLPRLALSVQFACLLLLSGCGGHESLPIAERNSVPSPSSQKEARIATFDLSTTNRVQNVYIVPNGFSGDLAVPTSAAKIAASVQNCRDEDFNVRWISDERLVVVFRQDRPSWINYVPYVEGVAIEIENQSKAPNRIPESTSDGAAHR